MVKWRQATGTPIEPEACLRIKINKNMKEKLPTYLLPDRPIAFNRDFVRIGCGIKGSLMLSQAVYWSRRTDAQDGSFWKTQEEWEEETGMTRHEQMNALKTLRKLDFIFVEKRGLPAKNYYIVNTNKILEQLSKDDKWSQKRTTSGTQSAITGSRKSGLHSNTEITTETTSDICDTLTKKTEDFVKELKESMQGLTLNKSQIEEIKKFVSYWTEPNKSKTKIKWELEKTWDMKRRVGTWMRNSVKFNKSNEPKGIRI